MMKKQSAKTARLSLKTITDENTPVYLLTASGFELQRVKAALEDSTVPCDATIKKCMENKYSKSIKAYTGYDDLTYDVYVPYSAYEKAFDTCVGIGAIKLEGEEILTKMLNTPRMTAKRLTSSLKNDGCKAYNRKNCQRITAFAYSCRRCVRNRCNNEFY